MKPDSIQWKRIFVERAAIVFSILLAFAIDAWWEERQEDDDERTLLIALKTEFGINLGKIAKELSYRRAVDESIMQILRAGAEEADLEPKELDTLRRRIELDLAGPLTHQLAKLSTTQN